jgi:hypothetical protein
MGEELRKVAQKIREDDPEFRVDEDRIHQLISQKSAILAKISERHPPPIGTHWGTTCYGWLALFPDSED